MIGCIEAGGTKFVCGCVDEHLNIHHRVSIPTTSPEETMALVLDYFKDKEVTAIGIASFGPLDLNLESKTYGYLTTTPKPYWAWTDIVGTLKQLKDVPIMIDTDVNAAALAEAKVGAAQGCDHVVYFTVGTGLGGGVLIHNQLVHGLMHPEFGHIGVKHHPKDDFKGACIYHHDCLEGMASGFAMEKRWGVKGHTLPQDHLAWDIEAYYLAQACVNALMVVSPQKIVFGGGVMHQEHLLPKVREHFKVLVNNYVVSDHLKDLDQYIVAAGCGDDTGLLGAYFLTQ
ncbi:MAG: ROK family protein [Erysipelotrichaceae bacterium]|nr:ROK family protein [Erysipelotrichaceae bacterium]